MADAFVSASKALYSYFKLVSKSLPDPGGRLSKALPLATIKAANEDVWAAKKQPKERPSKSRKR